MGKYLAEFDYSSLGDMLHIGNGVRKKSGSGSWSITTNPMFHIFYSEDGKCVLAYLYDAAQILLPPLTEDAPVDTFHFAELSGEYHRDTDTLTFGNGRAVTVSEEMAEGIMAHYDEGGNVVAFTLANASKTLLPHLRTWRGAENESERS